MNFKNIVYKNKDVILVFVLTFVLFFIVQFSTENLPGNDSYLYIKLADMTKSQGLLKEFPWLNATVMKDNFTGLHFLYYILLVPFTFLGDLIIGAKVASLFFLSTTAAVFCGVLKSLKLKYSLFWYLLLLSSSGYFLFRMNLARPLSFSVILSLLIFYALIKNNNLLLFLVSFLFVWAHGSFPLVMFLVLAFAAVNYSYDKRVNYKAILSSLAGITAAVFINPFFPNNINYFNIYYFTPTPYFLTSGISEWQSLGIDLIFSDAPILSVLFLVLLAIYCVKFILGTVNSKRIKGVRETETETKTKTETKNKTITTFLFIISLSFFIGMLLQGRFIDYWVPFSIIFIAFYIELLLKTFDTRWLFSGFSPMKPSCIKGSTALSELWNQRFFSLENIKSYGVPILAVVMAFSIWSKANFVLYMFGTNEVNKNIQEISQWLEKNTPEKSIVFNVNWGDFSKLFFYNTHNYYIMGLDPKFIYLISPEKYWLYAHIGEGVICSKEKCEQEENKRSIYEVIKKEFNADYVFVSTADKEFDYTNLIAVLNFDSQFEEVYENNGGKIWKIK